MLLVGVGGVASIVGGLTVGRSDLAVSTLPRPTFGPTGTDPAPTTTAIPAIYGSGACPKADGSSTKTQQFAVAFAKCIDDKKKYTALVETSHGEFTIALDTVHTPLTANNFVALARFHYFDATPCPSVYTDFATLCGTPTGKSTDGPGYTIPDEVETPGDQFTTGAVALIKPGPGAGGSLFIVILGKAQPTKPFTIFGKVASGQKTLTAISGVGSDDGKPVEPVTITKVTISET